LTSPHFAFKVLSFVKTASQNFRPRRAGLTRKGHPVPRLRKDLPPETIRHLLNRRGLTFADVDRTFGLVEGSARKAARYPMLAGELAIAEALGRSPRELWPARYQPDGTRKRPIPMDLYRNPPRLRPVPAPSKSTPTGTAGQRQKERVA
jgi:lambda repressor-like predicted transcriptional regulator